METGILLSNLYWLGARKTGQTMTCIFKGQTLKTLNFWKYIFRTCMYDALIGEKFMFSFILFMKGPAYHIYHSTDFV